MVETPEDMIRGFLVSGLDILLFNGKFVVDFDESRMEALSPDRQDYGESSLTLVICILKKREKMLAGLQFFYFKMI